MTKTIENLIAGSFGVADHKFALHPADEKRAFELLERCRDELLSLADVREKIAAYLRDHKCSPSHIDEQLNEVDRMFGPWLDH